MKTIFLLLILSVAALAQLTDSRDGKKYKTVKIGTQTWLAENLNYNVEGSKCYDNKSENCAKYGRLYDWEMAMKACPKGWHLPSNKEWDVLYRYVDSDYDSGYKHSKIAGTYLKAKSGWNEGRSGNGEDKYGFAALPSGSCTIDIDYIFEDVGDNGYWWSASEEDAARAYLRNMSKGYPYAIWGSNNKTGLFSVRCLQD